MQKPGELFFAVKLERCVCFALALLNFFLPRVLEAKEGTFQAAESA